MMMELRYYEIAFMFVVGIVTTVYSSNDFVDGLKEMNTQLLSAHVTSLKYLTDQQSTVSRLMSTQNFDAIAETSNAIMYINALQKQSHCRLNRKTDLKRQCWLCHFYQINQLSADNLSQLSKCSIDNINSTVELSNRYFHSMVDAMLYESALGTTNTLYTIGMYNPLSEQWKISRTLESIVKYSVDAWNGTVSIVDGEVQQIRNGIEGIFHKLEVCDSKVVQKFLNTKTEITSNKCV